jgi:penicillin-binding protein A
LKEILFRKSGFSVYNQALVKKDSWLTVMVSVLGSLGIVWVLGHSRPVLQQVSGSTPKLQTLIQQALAEPLAEGNFPEQIRFAGEDASYLARASYTLIPSVQERMEKLFEQYRPDYGAFVALDPETGRILSLVSYIRDEDSKLGNLALRATFPAASIFKVVTATAALDSGKLNSDSVIAFNGGDHTLYKRNITSFQKNRWSRLMSVKRAFAKSVNTVFGLVGIQHVGEVGMEEYAERFLFNREIPGDLPVQDGAFEMPRQDAFSIAEVASGYNRWVRMSPLQGALIAAAVANEGVIVEPHIVDGLLKWDGTPAVDAGGAPLYQPTPKVVSQVMRPETSYELRKLMRETVQAGTAVGAFAGIRHRIRSDVFEIGGKTGSLRGTDPVGNTDWFVGYALAEGSRVAVAALTVNVDKWRIKSSRIARHFLEGYYAAPKRARTR